MKKLYIIIAVYVLASVMFAAYTIQQLIKYQKVIDAQANELIVQVAAWNVLLSSFPEEDRVKFQEAVNTNLKK